MKANGISSDAANATPRGHVITGHERLPFHNPGSHSQADDLCRGQPRRARWSLPRRFTEDRHTEDGEADP
jgi:hypothetical protein